MLIEKIRRSKAKEIDGKQEDSDINYRSRFTIYPNYQAKPAYLGFHSIILSPSKSSSWVKENRLKGLQGIILSGGSASVYDANA